MVLSPPFPSAALEPAAAEKLVTTIQELSLARDLATVMGIVRRRARELTGADGATFVLKDGACCYYADEDAIAPLWKGRRFPLETCISGWVMHHREPAVIEDIYADPRIPAEAYRPTFVQSLAMVPIRVEAPIAAIGNYWARPHRASTQEVRLLQALANSTSVAMENIALYQTLEARVQTRTRELEAANRELEAFAFSASHDLRAPLRAIQGFAGLLAEECGKKISPTGEHYLDRINVAATRMNALIDAMLSLARISGAEAGGADVDLGALAEEILRGLAEAEPERRVRTRVARPAPVRGDPDLLRAVLDNLLRNAWKFTAHTPDAHIEFGVSDAGRPREFFVRDNGAGFPAAAAQQLFTPFHRLHSAGEFPGHGIGLATVRRIILKHGGDVRAVGAVDAGATIFFTLPPGER